MPWYTGDTQFPPVDRVEQYYRAGRGLFGHTSVNPEISRDGWGRGRWNIPQDSGYFRSDTLKKEHRNKAGQLHNARGPAVITTQGKEYYFLNGVNVPKALVTGPITVEDILKCDNTEVARTMMERYGGIEKFALDVNAQLVDEYTDQEGLPVRLYHAKLANGFVLAFLHMFDATDQGDGTHRPYILQVPGSKLQAMRAYAGERQREIEARRGRRVNNGWSFNYYWNSEFKKQEMLSLGRVARAYNPKSARCAMAWTWGMTEEEYAPCVQT